jgi:hypothetical protein
MQLDSQLLYDHGQAIPGCVEGEEVTRERLRRDPLMMLDLKKEEKGRHFGSSNVSSS